MSMPILTTKLYIPPRLPNMVSRPRLIGQLNEGLHRKQTLISAPAGFGKTTLVTSWLEHHEQPVAWLALDESDSDLSRFMVYLVAALQTVDAKIGKELLKAHQSPQLPPIDILLTPLLNDIAAVTQDFILVLDDYHVVDSVEVDKALGFLLDHIPPQMHIVMTTREDPQLPLARLRARGQLTEIRVADLRFTTAEASEFLSHTMNLNLSEENILALEKRTEGWIVGLQLAAVSMQNQSDKSAFIEAFRGSHQYVLDYLVEEVLHQQSEPIQTFLLQTCILDRLCADLCDAVTGATNSQEVLDYLARANLFLVALDNERRWFRYHHLFSDLLRQRLQQRKPLSEINTLHHQASVWYEDKNDAADAVRHALAAEDFERVASLAELNWQAMDTSFQTTIWLDWVRRLPEEMLQNRPVLSTSFGWALLARGDLEAANTLLTVAEQCLDATNKIDGMVIVDEAQFRSLPATIASARAYYAQANGDVLSTIKYGQQALDFLPESDYLRRGIAGSLLGTAYFTIGNLDTAYNIMADGMENLHKSGNILFALRGTYVLADIRLAQGHLRDAIRIYEKSLQLASEQGDDVLRGTADLYLRLSELYHEIDEVQLAQQCLHKGKELGVQTASPHWGYRLYLAQARIQLAQSDLEGALTLLDEAERRYVRTPVPDVHPIAALKTRIWIAQERLTEALQWAREQGLTVDDELSYLREYEYVTLARLLIAQYKRDGQDETIREAMYLLQRLLEAAEAGGRMGSVLEIRILQALAHEAQANPHEALVSLECALVLAEPEGYVQIFVNEGAPMKQLLSELYRQGIMADYTQKLLNAFAAPSEKGASQSPANQSLIEPLSERELEILQLVADGLSNHEISERLFLALSTVKGHNRNIYSKLGVKRRTEAVALAQELGLLSS